ncbi:MAG: hypothetical protein IJB11_04480 [Oscillospiraceae bacterium]|nr:hypothetical protein [Oscillospiraceae bacterium]
MGVCYGSRIKTEQFNATRLWRVACRRLDGGNSTIFANGKNANESVPNHQKTLRKIRSV